MAMAKIFFFFFPTDTLLFVSLDFIYEFLCFAFKLKTCNKSSPLFFFFFQLQNAWGDKRRTRKVRELHGESYQPHGRPRKAFCHIHIRTQFANCCNSSVFQFPLRNAHGLRHLLCCFFLQQAL